MGCCESSLLAMSCDAGVEDLDNEVGPSGRRLALNLESIVFFAAFVSFAEGSVPSGNMFATTPRRSCPDS